MPIPTPKQRFARLMNETATAGKEVYVDSYTYKLLKEGKQKEKQGEQAKAAKKK